MVTWFLNYRKLAFLLVFIFISSFISQALLILIQPTTQSNDSKQTSLTSSQPVLSPHSKVASESQTIDSFDVNPAYRWNQTSQGNLNATTDNSNLLLTNYANSTQANYTANRQLTKTDSKVEWRSSSAVSGNTSEYFRDQLGTPMTFDSSTQGWITAGTATISQTNGMLKVISSATYSGANYDSANYISKQVYTNISFDIYCTTSSVQMVSYINYVSGGVNYGVSSKSFVCPTILTTENFLLSSYTNSPTFNKELVLFNRLQLFTSTSSSAIFYLDNIQLLGSYNYPTMNLGNNWGFDSSKEYFYDQLGNISNFQDSTNENNSLSTTTTSLALTNFNLPTQFTGNYYNSTAQALSPLPNTYLSKQGTLQITIYAYVASGTGTITLYRSIDNGTSYQAIDSTAVSGSYNYLSDYNYIVLPVNYSLYYKIGLYQSAGSYSLVYVAGSSSISQATYILNFPNSYYSSPYYYIQNNYLTTNASLTSQISYQRTSLSIDSAIYKYPVVEFYTNVTPANITLYNLAGQSVCSNSTTLTTGWQLFSCSSVSNWSGTQTGYNITFYFSSSSNINLLLNFIGLYDSSLSNTENWNVPNSYVYNYVDPQGYLVNHIFNTSSGLSSYTTGLSINTNIYKYLTIRIKADSDTNRYFILGQNIGIIPGTQVNTSFQIFTFDLTSNPNWIGTITSLNIYYVRSSGLANPLTDSIFTIDYILLTAAPQQQQPFQIGLLNPTTFQPTLNVTQVFFNASTFRWQVELYDSYGTIAAYAYSTNQTFSANTFYRGKLTFVVETSTLEIKITTDGGSNLFDAVYPDNFVVTNPQNTFFGLGSGTFPDVYFASYAPPASYSQTYLDFINAPFAEQNWKATNFPVPSSVGDPSYNLITHPSPNAIINPFSSNFLYSLQGYEYYSLDIPQLDSVTGTINQINHNATFTFAGGLYLPDTGNSLFCINNVQPQNGSLLNIFCAQIVHSYNFIDFQLYNYSNSLTIKYLIPGSTSFYTNIIKEYRLNANNNWDNKLDFNVQTLNQRSIFQIQTNAVFNTNDTSTNVYPFTYSLNLTNLNLFYSNEFVITYGNSIIFDNPSSTGQLTYSLDNFGFTARDIFAGVTGAVLSVIHNADPIISGFNWLANAINQVLMIGFRYLALVFATTLVNAVQPIITILTTMSTKLTSMETNLSLIYAAFTGWMKTDLDYLSQLASLANIKTDLDNIYTLLSGWDTAIKHITDVYNILNGTAFSNAIDNITNMYNILNSLAFTNAIDNITNLYNLFNGLTFVNSLWSALFGAAVWSAYIDPFINHLLSFLATTALSPLETLLENLLNWFVTTIIIDILVKGIIDTFSYAFNLLLAILPWNWGAFITQFNNLNLTDIMTTTTNFFNWILAQGSIGLNMFFLGLTAYIFALPWAVNHFELGPSLQDILHNFFTLHGVDENIGFGNATIPVKINAGLVWIILATLITINGVTIISYFLPVVPW